MAEKSTMRVVSHYLCDSCNVLIDRPEFGVVVIGNITVADPNNGGGLIGGPIPETGPLPTTVLCKKCFCKALDLDLTVKR